MDEGVGVAPARGGSAVGWLTPLVGRESELADVRGLLEDARLVTLTGAGGVGKTRLALELITKLAQATECVLVQLAPLDPSGRDQAGSERVAGAIWRAIAGASADHDQQAIAPLDAIANHFDDHAALLVLDNCEHLGILPGLADTLLRRCPRLRVLATSRRALELSGETTYLVPPLSVPAPDAEDALAAVLESEAGRLFLQRARRSLPSFDVVPSVAPAVGEICRHLDGLALAIELAAARVRVLSPHQILDGISDRFELLSAREASSLGRHRSLQASLDWSYQLLDVESRALLRILAAASDWSLEAMEAVGGPARALFDGLARLIDAGLLALDEHGERRRYRLLATVRSYALERLRAAGEEAEVRRAHLGYFRKFALEADRLLESDEGRRSLDLEAQNLREALRFAAHEDPAQALSLAADLRHWLLLSEDPGEALGVCIDVVEAVPAGDPVALAHVLHAAAVLAIFQDDYPHALAYAGRAAPLAEASDDPGAKGLGVMLASIAQRAIDPGTSAELGWRSVELLREAGDGHALALALAQVAMTEALRDRFDSMRQACDEFRLLTRGRTPAWLSVWLEVALAWADLAQGDPRSSLAHSERGIALERGRRSLGYYIALWRKLHALTLVGEAQRARETAQTALEEAERAGLGAAAAALGDALGLAELGLDELDAVRARFLKQSGDPHFAAAATANELLARVELAQARALPLARHAAALRAIGERTGNHRLRALASWAEGSAAMLSGRFDDARSRLHEALALQLEQQLRPDALDTVEAIAELHLTAGRAEPAARLLGAADHARMELELRRLPPREEHFGALEQQGIELIGAAAWTEAQRDGQRMSFDDATAYARRGRGPHAQAVNGLASLTPTELKVVEAAGEGLTNAAIAARLFMSHGTVKAHLAHAYRKLDVESRYELVMLVHDQKARG